MGGPGGTATRSVRGLVERKCFGCQMWQPITEFYSYQRPDHRPKYRGAMRTRWTKCKTCMHGETLETQRRKKAWIDQYKLSKGCADCGYAEHPAALDFDHLPGQVKYLDIRHGSSMGWKRIYAEVEKCEVVCANCHRIRTVERYAAEREGGDALMNTETQVAQ